MKKSNRLTAISKMCMVAFLLSALSLLFFSFTVSKKMADDFFKQLGITQAESDKKITSSFLAGYLDAYGVKNAKNIALDNRTAVTRDLLNYTKKYVNSPAFIKEYVALKESNRPVKNKIKTPEELQQEMIADAKKAIINNEATLKKADQQFKNIYEDVLVQSKMHLKEAEDPNNKNLAAYRKNYEALVKETEESYMRQLAYWEAAYPSNHMLYIKKRLLEFMSETTNIDYSAELITKNGVKYFVSKDYERKSKRWKMAFRAGREVLEPTREFVQQWINEIE